MEEQNKKEPKKNSVSSIVIAVIVVAVVFGLIAIIGSSASNSDSTSSGSVAASVPSGCGNPNLEQQAQTISYPELEKDPNSFNGTIAEFTGQVIQIEQANGQGVIRLAVDKIYGIWNQSDVVYISYEGDNSVVQGDVINVYGPLTGVETYTSEANFQISVPSMTGCIIQEASTSQPAAVAAVTPTQAVPATLTPSANPVPQAQPTQQANSVPTAQVTPATWHTVMTYTGPDTQNTAPFSMQGSEWRITYSCTLNPGQYGGTSSLFQGMINSVADGAPVNIFANGSCPQNNTSYVYSQPPGQYALQVQSYNASYNIKIEDYY